MTSAIEKMEVQQPIHSAICYDPWLQLYLVEEAVSDLESSA
jgi:hypothetical protein